MIEYTLMERDGRIAVGTPWDPEWDTPKYGRVVWVFPQAAKNYSISTYPKGTHTGNNRVSFTHNLTHQVVSFLCDEDTATFEEKPFPPPGRGGKNWKWDYRNGQWRKEYK